MTEIERALKEELRIINAAKEFYSLPLQLQPWGPQNQNGDDCESILMDADGETVVYGIPDEIGDLAVLASTALPLRNAQVKAALKWAEKHAARACGESIRRAIEEAGA